MNRPLIVLAGLIIVGGTAGAAFVIASPGGEEELVQQVETPIPTTSVTVPSIVATPTPAAGETLWRWGNVTVLIVEGSGIYASSAEAPPDLKPPNGGRAVRIFRSFDLTQPWSSSVLIDAETGLVLATDVLQDDQAAIDAVLHTVSVSPLDPATAPWPYNGKPTDGTTKDQFENISFIRPAPSTGLQVHGGLADPCCGAFIVMTNGPSTIIVGPDPAGELFTDFTHVLPQDREVMERWAATVKACDGDLQC